MLPKTVVSVKNRRIQLLLFLSVNMKFPISAQPVILKAILKITALGISSLKLLSLLNIQRISTRVLFLSRV